MMEYLLGQEGERMIINDPRNDGSTPLHFEMCFLEGKERLEMIKCYCDTAPIFKRGWAILRRHLHNLALQRCRNCF